MNRNDKEVVENLKAQLKCVQSDIFSALKRYVKIFSIDPALSKIVKEPYCTVNMEKYTLGLDGKRNYGVIDSCDFEKRDEIVKNAKAHLVNLCIDTPQKITDMELIILNYQKAGNYIKNISLIPALKNHLDNLRYAYRAMLEREGPFANRLS